MASIINATTTNGVAISADNSGILQLATNSGTTALTLSVAQAATFVSSVTATSLTAPILSSATTLSLQTNGSTTAVTIDASQNVGIGTSSPTSQLDQYLSSGTTYRGIRNGSVAIQEYASTTIAACVYGTTSNHPLLFTTNNTERMRIDSSGNVLVTNPAGLGYGTGSGGTVTQATSKSTAVTLNKPTGQITTSNSALAAGTQTNFTFANSLIGASDSIILCMNYSTLYSVRTATISAGNCVIVIKNEYSTSLSEPLIINFAIIKGATA